MIKRNLLFWFDGKDNQADGNHDLNAETWKIKDPVNNTISDVSLFIFNCNWLPTGGIYFSPEYHYINDDLGIRMPSSPMYLLGSEVPVFTIEVTCDIEEIPSSENRLCFFWAYDVGGSSSSAARRFYYNNTSKQIFFEYRDLSAYRTYTVNFNSYVESGIHTYTLFCNGTILSLYIDGKFSDSKVLSGSLLVSRKDNFGYFSLGGDNSVYPIRGIFYSYKMYDTALTDDEILQSTKHSLQRYSSNNVKRI